MQRVKARSEPGARAKAQILRLEVVDEHRQICQAIARWIENFSEHRTPVRIEAPRPPYANGRGV
jgi:hypothetical protein